MHLKQRQCVAWVVFLRLTPTVLLLREEVFKERAFVHQISDIDNGKQTVELN